MQTQCNQSCLQVNSTAKLNGAMTSLQLVIAMLVALIAAFTSAPARTQATNSADAIVVTGAQALVDAVEGHAAHVHITEHLDLRNLRGNCTSSRASAIAACSHQGSPLSVLLNQTSSLMSITVRHAKESYHGDHLSFMQAISVCMSMNHNLWYAVHAALNI